MTHTETHQAISAVWRIEQAKLVASLARMLRDIGVAEELAQDALVAALERWPQTGIPDNPGAWLMATAKRRAIDRLRHRKLADAKHAEIGYISDLDQDSVVDELEARLDDDIGDDLLKLVFTACHPILSAEARVALTLRLIGGLSTGEIARAFFVPESTVAQRIVRAKRTLADANVPYEVPRGDELAKRLASVIEVIYLIFNEGYSATAGEDWIRPQLADEAVRLGRILAGLAPNEADVHGLVALMEIQASRFAARIGPNGEPVLLMDQNRARWDHLLIRRGLAALTRAEALGPRGTYTLQAAIAACHARAPTADQTDWRRIAGLYAELGAIAPSPVVELNRAVAVGMAEGPAAGLAVVEPLATEPALASSHLLPGVRADLLMKLGRLAEAKLDFERAAALTRNLRERQLLLERAATCANGIAV
ncbi:RNA polymerase sigma factor [Kaistia nematophila]|uniref:RNA polymerase sigma factor n=1 Tax=Kaistia nematophila TaxID=2994654 RepID=A0A9X3E5L3_9HYPH|nr:RNA polymerase sigma factor [Kaistia nematophila]